MATSPPLDIGLQSPPGWVNKSMVIYAAPERLGRPVAPTIVVARDALGKSETFREYCNRQIDGFRAALPHFHRAHEGPVRVHERDAFQIEFSWASGGGQLRQRVFFIDAEDGVVVTYTATAADDEYHQHEPVFQQGLAGLSLTPTQRH